MDSERVAADDTRTPAKLSPAITCCHTNGKPSATTQSTRRTARLPLRHRDGACPPSALRESPSTARMFP